MAALGRPRDPGLDEMAMQTAIELIVESGFPALTMERVAARASVSRAALYRRWPNKVELVADAVESFALSQGPLPDTGRLPDDITELLYGLVRNRSANLETYEALVGAMAGDPELGKRCREALKAKFSESLRAIVSRAVERGELPTSTDVELLATVVPALAFYRARALGQQVDCGYVDRVVAQFFSPPGA